MKRVNEEAYRSRPGCHAFELNRADAAYLVNALKLASVAIGDRITTRISEEGETHDSPALATLGQLRDEYGDRADKIAMDFGVHTEGLQQEVFILAKGALAEQQRQAARA